MSPNGHLQAYNGHKYYDLYYSQLIFIFVLVGLAIISLISQLAWLYFGLFEALRLGQHFFSHFGTASWV